MLVMRKHLFLVMLLCAILTIGFTSGAYAQDSKSVSVAVVNVQKILTESKVAKNIQDQAQKRKKALQEEFSKLEDILRKSEKKLLEQRASLSTEEFMKKRDEFEQNLLEARSKAQRERRTLDEALLSATNTIRGEILKVVTKLSEERGYDLVLTRQNIVLVSKSHDITKDVLEAVNEALPKLKLKLS